MRDQIHVHIARSNPAAHGPTLAAILFHPLHHPDDTSGISFTAQAATKKARPNHIIINRIVSRPTVPNTDSMACTFLP
jgi:cobalamin biosynthesis protein CbiD